MIRIIGPYLRIDKYGCYLWAPRFCASAMCPLRFWGSYRTFTPKYHGGTIHFGPFHVGWYDRAAWER